MEDQDKLYDFVKNLDMSPVFKKICGITGNPNIKFHKNIEFDRQNHPHLIFSSGDISNEAGVMSFALGDLVISNSASFITNPSSEKDSLCYLLKVQFRYKLKNDSRRGGIIEFLEAHYVNGNWEFSKINSCSITFSD